MPPGKCLDGVVQCSFFFGRTIDFSVQCLDLVGLEWHSAHGPAYGQCRYWLVTEERAIFVLPTPTDSRSVSHWQSPVRPQGRSRRHWLTEAQWLVEPRDNLTRRSLGVSDVTRDVSDVSSQSVWQCQCFPCIGRAMAVLPTCLWNVTRLHPLDCSNDCLVSLSSGIIIF